MPVLEWRKASGFKLTCYVVICSAALSFILPPECLAGAARSRAGGGESAEMDWGSIGMSIGITVGAALVTSAVSSAFRAAAPAASSTTSTVPNTIQADNLASLGGTDFYNVGIYTTENLNALNNLAGTTTINISKVGTMAKIGNTITNIPRTLGNLVTNNAGAGKAVKPLSAAVNSFSDWREVAKTAVKGYAIYTATTQTSRAMAAVGNYHGWDRNTVFLGSSLATGAVAGYLNPSGALGDTLSKSSFEYVPASMGRGMFVGALGGLGRGGVILGIDGDKIAKGENPGVWSEVAGTAGGIFATELGRVMVNPDTNLSQMVKWKPATDAKGKIIGYEHKGNIIPEDELKKAAGLDIFQKALNEKGIAGIYGTDAKGNKQFYRTQDLTLADFNKIVNSDQAAYLRKIVNSVDHAAYSDSWVLRLNGPGLSEPIDIPITP
ncbi:MAG: hypothetical protein Q8N85_05345, partial [Candidatus Omnitrophota bacterium]|nr:hypothetical protein [Candidatus Omnitrophota bacterium]